MKLPHNRFAAIINEQFLQADDLLEIMADSLGISLVLLRAYYNNEVEPEAHHLTAIAHYFNRVFHEDLPLYSLQSFTENEE